MSKSIVMPLILLLAVMVFVKGAKGPVKDLTAAEKKQKLGGDAKILVDCPRNEKNECEPPISVSFETPNSKKTYFCQENKLYSDNQKVDLMLRVLSKNDFLN